MFKDTRPINPYRVNKNYTMKEIIYSGTILEKIINSKKIKYTVLDGLLKNKIPPNKDTVTLYIDLNDLLNSFYNPNNLEKFKTINDKEKMSISSELLNIGAHYRNYFSTRHDMYTNIIYYYSLEEDSYSTKILSTYKNDFYNKRVRFNNEFYVINEILKKQLQILDIISKYIPHLYCINTKHLNPTIVPYYCIQHQKFNEFGIIYTNNKIESLNAITDSEALMLTAKSDKSDIINNLDIKDWCIEKKDKEYNFSSDLLPYVYAISGYKKLNIDGINNYGKIKSANIIEKLIKEGKLSDIDYKDPDLFIDDIKKANIFTDSDLKIIKRNIILIKPEFIFNNINESDIITIMEFIDLVDAKSLHSLNAKYYTHYPIMLEEIMMGEEYE